ncbi:MAG: response regulator transcription factor [Lachnospiraceae bacterium]|nr:response regulator transcription factor [Lachnospiraceae bacterium]
MKYKLLIVDDDEDIIKMLKDYFGLLDYLVYTASTGKEAINQLTVNPDLILLDINMPEMDGIEVCKKIRSHINVPIVFLTAKIEEQDKINGLMAGGDDYIIKPFSMGELNARIMAHLRREERGRDKTRVYLVGNLAIDYDNRIVSIGEENITFTKTEFAIIELLSSNKGRIFDKDTIYENLWGFDKDGDSSIITEHIRRIRSKFADKTDKNVIETVWGVGYKWVI